LRGIIQHARPRGNVHAFSPAAASTAQLDATDIAILTEFQDRGRISNTELAFRVVISQAQCLRRLRALREQGIIKGVRTIVDPRLLNCELVLFAMIQLRSQAQVQLGDFERFVDGQKIVRQSWLLSADIDYLLKCVARDFAEIRRFISALTSLPNVRTIRTSLVLAKIIDAALVPLGSR
jgi:DNA-binding Lrp family transcriptional regulator